MTASPLLKKPHGEHVPAPKGEARPEVKRLAISKLDASRVWRDLTRASFAVLTYVAPDGAPRSSGIVYAAVGRRLYVAVAPDSWKARQLTSGQTVSLTVPIRRGGLLSLFVPIPPATIIFRATATLHPAGSLEIASLSKELARLLPDARRDDSCVFELEPRGQFLTYGIGVSLLDMRKPERARTHVPVA